ncbi:MAG: MFS transporter [Caldilineaceae bacterium]|nr:MFS transporter [Caldilineaceae bacterium]
MTILAWGRSMLRPLTFPDYRRLLIGNILWWQGFYMEMVVIGWLVFELTNSPWMVSVVSFCRSLPLLLIGFWTGPLIDHFGRRTIILAAQTANLCAYLAMVLLLWSGAAAVWNIAIVALVLGTAWASDWPARRALLPDIVGKEQTVDSMLLDSFLVGIGRMLTPSLAGALIAAFGAIGCYSVMVLLSAAALWTLRTLTRQPIPRTNMRPMARPWTLIGHGLLYVRHNQTILAVLLITVVMNLWIFPYVTLLPIFARDVLHQGPVGLGLLSTGNGIGAFLGLIVVNLIRRRYSNGWIFIVGSVWACLAVIAFAFSTHYGLSWSMLFVAGLGLSCFGALQSAIILLTASDEMRSRVMGLLVLAIGSDPLGQLQMGYLAERLGPQATLTSVATAATIAVVLIAIFLPSLRRPAAHLATPMPVAVASD